MTAAYRLYCTKEVGDIATKPPNRNRMGAKQKIKNRFIAVDVWRPTFGEPSVKAINEIYHNLSQKSHQECRAISLRQKVDFLRKLDDPTYKPISMNR